MEVKDPALVRRKRKQKRYSQRELAFLVRRTQTTIHKIENGQLKNITEDLAVALAARLDADWEDLFVAHEESAMPVMSSVSPDGSNTAA
ncbi:helix-turn-helix domain-containing protein [Mycolicibacterium fortuitum]|uniref:helix-turn-helix domain-containing protein n=1 Tax=Mycolicibacterium fortuitum TaxID=1766 RepID=UPI00148FAAA8|nr:helix-turn-helix transcriptional regulator [Mycolicibacterium fortuitum]